MATFEGRFTDAQGLRIGVVVARFNDLVTSKLLSGCLDCLSRHGVDASATSAQLDLGRRGIDAVVRASLHVYNTRSEVDRVLGVVEQLARSASA